MGGEHRSAERSLYDRLQLEENKAARERLEALIADPERNYQQICDELNSSGLFESIKRVYPQDLTRYRQRKAQVESKASVLALIEHDAETLVDAATRHPTGVIAGYLRRMLTEHVVHRFGEAVDEVDPVDLSRETARHALVEQRDRRIDLEQQRIELESRRIDLQQRAADLQRDRFQLAADAWRFVLSWFQHREPAATDLLARHSEELLGDLENWIVGQG